MFTGIVEEIGTIQEARPGELIVAAREVLSDLKLGDSIAVNGACLTIVERTETTFRLTVQPETLRRTNLGSLQAGQRVNLERAMPANGRFGGHIVQGHIDGTGQIVRLEPDGDGLLVYFAVPLELLRYIVPKGFIAVDGTSLTVVDIGPDWFNVALIQYTRDHVTLLDQEVGKVVNIEVDILGKYIERLLGSENAHRRDAESTEN